MVTSPELPEVLRAEYPFPTQAFVTPGGARMSYVDEGPRTDTAVLLLHGNPTWSFYYRHLVRALAPSLRCVAPDHIGMGLSDKPEGYRYTLAQRIDDIAALVAMLGLRRIHLVVHDWGGAIGCGLSARHPGLVDRVVILNTGAFHSTRIPGRIALCRLPWVGPLLVRGFNGFAWPATWMAMHRRALSSLEKAGYLWPYRSWADRVAVSEFVRDIPLRPGDRSWDALTAVEQGLPALRSRPALIIWGGRDFCFDDHFLARWRAELPHATVHRLADAGHYVLDDAREDVIPRIAGFLGGS